MRRLVRGVGALVLGLALGGLPFVYYRYGVGRHHAHHQAPRPEDAAKEVDHASSAR